VSIVSAPPKIFDPEATVTIALRAALAHFRSFGTTRDVARVTAGDAR
jgi:hypothetical protein